MEKETSINHSKKFDNTNIMIILFVFILIMLVFSVTYAVFLFSKQGDRKNSISTGSLSFTYTESSEGIYLTNAMPTTDDTGKTIGKQDDNRGYFDFNVSCTVTSNTFVYYEIFATPMMVDNPLSWDYVKVYLTDITDDTAVSGYKEDVPTFKQLSNSDYSSNSKRLYYGVFKESSSKNFRLRLWLSSDYGVTTEQKMFKMKVGVKASS